MANIDRDSWYEAEIKLSEEIEFKIIHNLPDQIEAAVQNWVVRTDDYTDKSLCDYINSKRERGLSDHYAFTEEEFLRLNS